VDVISFDSIMSDSYEDASFVEKGEDALREFVDRITGSRAGFSPDYFTLTMRVEVARLIASEIKRKCPTLVFDQEKFNNFLDKLVSEYDPGKEWYSVKRATYQYDIENNDEKRQLECIYEASADALKKMNLWEDHATDEEKFLITGYMAYKRREAVLRMRKSKKGGTRRRKMRKTRKVKKTK
jgi:hypothetical protein